MARMPTQPLRAGVVVDTATGELTPWEQRDRLGLGPGLIDTLRESAFSPGKFFAALRPDVPWTEAFWYGWLLQALFGAVGAVLFLLQTFGAAAATPLRLLGLLVVPLAPVVLYPAIVLVLGAVVHCSRSSSAARTAGSGRPSARCATPASRSGFSSA